jgi:hypothetical protein
MSRLEHQAKSAWRAWGDYAQYTRCSGCQRHTYCRRTSRSPWLCLDCFDLKGA